MRSICDGGFLVAVEGIDGLGKTTAAALIAQYCGERGIACVLSKEPTSLRWGRALRQSAAEGRLTLEKELEFFELDRRDHVARTIRPALDAGQVVLLDRYYISSAAYQGSRGAEPEAIMTAHEAFAPVPDLILLLDAPAAVGLDRIRRRGDTPNLFETEDALTAVRAIFLDVTRHRPHAARIDADRPWREVVREALARFTDAAAAKIARMHSGADAAERTAALLAEDVPPPPTH